MPNPSMTSPLTAERLAELRAEARAQAAEARAEAAGERIGHWVQRLESTEAKVTARDEEIADLHMQLQDERDARQAAEARIAALEEALRQIAATDDKPGIAVGAPAQCAPLARTALAARDGARP